MSTRASWILPGLGHLRAGQGVVAAGLWGLLVLLGLAARTLPARAPHLLGLGELYPSWVDSTALIAWPALAAAVWWASYRQAHPADPDRSTSSVVRALIHHPTGRLGAVGVAWLVAVALLAPLLAPYDPTDQRLGERFLPPSMLFPMGTDKLGRDVASRLAFGARISMTIGLVAVAIAASVGTAVGAMAGWVGGRTDRALMWVVDLLLATPRLVLLLAIMGLWRPSGAQGIALIVVVLGLTGWMGVARIVRSETLSLRERPFVEAARALGVPEGRILLRHVVPNAMGPVIVYASLAVGSTMLAEAALSFLGLGVQAPAPAWGRMVLEGQSEVVNHPWLAAAPGLAIMAAVMSFNLLGDGLRDALDPRQRHGPGAGTP